MSPPADPAFRSGLHPARRVLLIAALLRAVATGMGGVLLGLWLAERLVAPSAVGAITAVGMAGAALAVLAVTLRGHRWPARTALLACGGTACLGALALPWVESLPLLIAVSLVGMLNFMGRDRGPAAVLEQALLPATTSAAARTSTFAWYTALQDAGHAVGGLAAALPALLVRLGGLAPLAALRGALLLHALLLAAATATYLALPRHPAAPGTAAARPRTALSSRSAAVVRRLALLFAVDGVGGGMLAAALLSYFFYARFGVGAAGLGLLFFAGRTANLLSHFAAAWLARRIGLLATVVWTHLPSSVLLLAIAFVPSLPVAVVLWLLRECLVEMDVPTRQSYVVAVVEPEERTAAAGWTQLARLAAWVVGPSLGGWLMASAGLAAPLIAAAVLKIAYDLALWIAFRRLQPPEERDARAAG